MNHLIKYKLSFQLPNDMSINRDNGKISQAIFLDAIHQVDEDLSNELHSGTSRRPYSIGRILLDSNQLNFWYFEIVISDGHLNKVFKQFLFMTHQPRLTVLGQDTTISQIQMDRVEFPEIAIPPVKTRIKFDFLTPTFLSADNRNIKLDPFPYPTRIWNTIWETWDANINSLDDEFKELFLLAVENQLSTPEFNIQSVGVRKFGNVVLPAFLGSITFYIEKNENLELIPAFTKLADVWGVGGKTTRGYGYVNTTLIYPKN